MGFLGLLILLMLIYNAFRILKYVENEALKLGKKANIYYSHIYSVKVGLITYLVIVTFVSATYTEIFYWFLMLPLFLKRSVENEVIYESNTSKSK